VEEERVQGWAKVVFLPVPVLDTERLDEDQVGD